VIGAVDHQFFVGLATIKVHDSAVAVIDCVVEGTAILGHVCFIVRKFGIDNEEDGVNKVEHNQKVGHDAEVDPALVRQQSVQTTPSVRDELGGFLHI
jgi:hypothetical protein